MGDGLIQNVLLLTLCRPSGAFFANLDRFPGLPPWAKLCRPSGTHSSKQLAHYDRAGGDSHWHSAGEREKQIPHSVRDDSVPLEIDLKLSHYDCAVWGKSVWPFGGRLGV